MKKNLNQKKTWELVCGCILKPETKVVSHEGKYHKLYYEYTVWVQDRLCKDHTANTKKKADKIVHNIEKLKKRNHRNDFEAAHRLKNRRFRKRRMRKHGRKN